MTKHLPTRKMFMLNKCSQVGAVNISMHSEHLGRIDSLDRWLFFMKAFFVEPSGPAVVEYMKQDGGLVGQLLGEPTIGIEKQLE